MSDKTTIRYVTAVIAMFLVFMVVVFINDNYKSQWKAVYDSQTQIACIKAGMQVIDGDCVNP